METESIARELGVRPDTTELQVGANTATEIIGRQQGQWNVRHMDVSYLWLLEAARRKQVTFKKVQSENNMAELETEAVDRHMEKLKCVRFDQWN